MGHTAPVSCAFSPCHTGAGSGSYEAFVTARCYSVLLAFQELQRGSGGEKVAQIIRSQQSRQTLSVPVDFEGFDTVAFVLETVQPQQLHNEATSFILARLDHEQDRGRPVVRPLEMKSSSRANPHLTSTEVRVSCEVSCTF